MSGIVRTGPPWSARLMANGWAEARLVPAQAAAPRAIANRLIANWPIANRWIVSVPNRFPTNPLQAIQLMAAPLTPDRPPAVGLGPDQASAVRLGRGQQDRAPGRLADLFSAVLP